MNKFGKLLLVILLIMAVLVVFSSIVSMIYLESTDQKEETYTSNYNYDINIETNGILDNLTLYLPVPVHENESLVGQDMLTKDFYNKAPEWNFSLIDTEFGPMLSIANIEVTPDYKSLPVPIEDSEDTENRTSITVESNEYSEETPVLRPITFSITANVNQSINTKYPIEKSSVLEPKYKLRTSESPYEIPNPDYIEPEYYEYESRIFAQYNTSNQTDVYIRVEVTGTNEWWVGGWRFNTFQDTTSVQMKGPQDGWIAAEGTMITGDGIYD